MENRIVQSFTKLLTTNRRAFIPYVMGGDPDLATSLKILHTLANNGADIIELGFAFSDPTADGNVIQMAHERVLKSHINLPDILDLIIKFRQDNQHTPIVLMGYLNPILAMGIEKFNAKIKQAQVDGVLVVDLSLEDSYKFTATLAKNNIINIYFITPTTSEERMKNIVKLAKGYIYYISVKGITGATDFDVLKVKQEVARIEQYTDLPIAIGFGIKDMNTIQELENCGHAVIVGSKIVSLIDQYSYDKNKIISELADITQKFSQSLIQ
ncbi:tryptophan synthase subunit alpha [Gammaproteobacteria bacterium]|nr:tryptophan synthase subunit alpha [Gammaproteobacteria bacterium]